MKLLRIAVLCAGIAAVVAFVGVGLPTAARSGSTPTPAAHSITVSGTGAVKVTPNQAGFTFGVSTNAKTATQALAANSTTMRKLIDALKAAGIPSDSLQTAYVSLSPNMAENGQSIVGYTASNSVSVTISSLSRAGEIVDAAVAAGANQVDGPSLTVADQSSLYDTALKAAVADARAKAEVLADASGLHLGGVASIEENGGTSPVNYDVAKAATPATPIEPGTQEITASVNVTFEAS
jgi:uncharacterized protein YggE